jgi:hypothetical protein
MTSTRPLGGAHALLAGLALGLGVPWSGRCQPTTPREVELHIRGSGYDYWQVDASGDGFVARHVFPGDRVSYRHSFAESAGGMEVSGKYMGYDLSGKSKEVLARERYGESTQWEKEGARFGMRLRVPHGPLKGWWVGLKVVEDQPAPAKPTLAKLVLVEDKKDAAVFIWADPYDEGR